MQKFISLSTATKDCRNAAPAGNEPWALGLAGQSYCLCHFLCVKQ